MRFIIFDLCAVAFVHNDSDILNELKQQSYFKDMQECDFFEVGGVQVIPDDCGEVKFKRNQRIAKIFSGESRRRLKRLKKRALARGEVFNPQKMTVPRVFGIFQRVLMSSGSNRQDYILHIQIEVVERKADSEFSQYGLAINSKFNGTVPDLSSLV